MQNADIWAIYAREIGTGIITSHIFCSHGYIKTNTCFTVTLRPWITTRCEYMWMLLTKCHVNFQFIIIFFKVLFLRMVPNVSQNRPFHDASICYFSFACAWFEMNTKAPRLDWNWKEAYLMRCNHYLIFLQLSTTGLYEPSKTPSSFSIPNMLFDDVFYNN